MTPAQRQHLFALWGDVRKLLRAQGLSVMEADDQRSELTEMALGKPKSWGGNVKWTPEEFDKVKAALLSLSRPDDMNAQLEALKQPLRRHLFVIDKLCAELGAGRAYANAIAKVMHSKGKIIAADVELLDQAGMRSVLLALEGQCRRKRGEKVKFKRSQVQEAEHENRLPAMDVPF